MTDRNYKVNYKGLTFNVLVDGAGLDIEATDDSSLADIKQFVEGSKSSELFDKIFDLNYSSIGLRNAIEKAGGEILA